MLSKKLLTLDNYRGSGHCEPRGEEKLTLTRKFECVSPCLWVFAVLEGPGCSAGPTWAAVDTLWSSDGVWPACPRAASSDSEDESLPTGHTPKKESQNYLRGAKCYKLIKSKLFFFFFSWGWGGEGDQVFIITLKGFKWKLSKVRGRRLKTDK